jgi:Spy/CpxP family protein refolding chaperone
MLARAILAAALLLPGLARAEVSPYAGHEARDIKALSKEEVEGLLQGRGMEMALPAELNGYPGPRHVLDLARELDLTGDQVAAIRPVQDRMLFEAKALGAEVVEAERALDRLFAAGAADREGLSKAVAAVAERRGRLRAAHLAAHLDVKAILSPEQVRRYDVLRGYAGAGETGHGAVRGHGHGHNKH